MSYIEFTGYYVDHPLVLNGVQVHTVTIPTGAFANNTLTVNIRDRTGQYALSGAATSTGQFKVSAYNGSTLLSAVTSLSGNTVLSFVHKVSAGTDLVLTVTHLSGSIIPDLQFNLQSDSAPFVHKGSSFTYGTGSSALLLSSSPSFEVVTGNATGYIEFVTTYALSANGIVDNHGNLSYVSPSKFIRAGSTDVTVYTSFPGISAADGRTFTYGINTDPITYYIYDENGDPVVLSDADLMDKLRKHNLGY